MSLRQRLLLALPMVCTLCACDAGYLAHLVAGQLEGLGRTVPIEEAAANSDLTDEERRKLALVISVRRFAIEEVGLNAGPAFTVFEASGQAPAAYVVSASARNELRPFVWSFPFVGDVPYKGFFNEQMARDERDALAQQGYDVLLSPAAGFSTLGLLPDPVRQSQLSLPDVALAEFICHELTHSTVFRTGDVDFNEALATFIGRTAAQAWFDREFGAASDESTQARLYFDDSAVVDAYAEHLYASAAEYYAAAAQRGDSQDKIISGRDAVFAAAKDALETEYFPQLHHPQDWAFLLDQPIDNALILAATRYLGGLDVFADVHEETGRDFAASIGVFRQAAEADDARGWLRSWLESH